MSEAEAAPIKVGEIVFVKLTGEPVFVLGKVEERTVTYRVAPGGTADPLQQMGQWAQANLSYADYVVRRYNNSKNSGSNYQKDYFTAAELTTTNPNNVESILDALMEEDNVEIEVAPKDTNGGPLSN